MVSASGWLRQARHRAKKYQAPSVLTIRQLRTVIAHYDSNCAYCGQLAVTFDNPVPFSDGGMNSQANVLPICRACKDIKRNHTIVRLYNSGALLEQDYVRLIRELLQRDVGEAMKVVLRRIVGIG